MPVIQRQRQTKRQTMTHTDTYKTDIEKNTHREKQRDGDEPQHEAPTAEPTTRCEPSHTPTSVSSPQTPDVTASVSPQTLHWTRGAACRHTTALLRNTHPAAHTTAGRDYELTAYLKRLPTTQQVMTNDILFINRLTAPPSATAQPAILSSRDRSIAGYS